MDLSAHVYDPMGRHLAAVPVSAASVKHTVSQAGSASLTVPDCPELERLDLGLLLREYGSIWLVKAGGLVRHAGWLLHWKYGDSLALDVGDGWSIWDKRLVMPAGLSAAWADGYVKIEDDQPPAGWVLRLSGSYGDIAAGLIRESMSAGALPYTLPERQGGSHEREYDAWDFAAVSTRLKDLTGLQDGPEIRFDPYVDQAVLRWRLAVGSPEIVDRQWQWNAALPRQRVELSAVDADGGGLAGQAYGVGGRSEDQTLVARSRSDRLTAQGWPLLQMADTSHSTVSELATLVGYVDDDVRSGDRPQVTIGVRCPSELDVHAGDWVDLRVPGNARMTGRGATVARLVQPIMGQEVWPLKVTDVAWTAGQDWQELQMRARW